MYHGFGAGATFATCAKTPKWDSAKLMPHMRIQLSGGAFKDRAAAPAPGSYTVEPGTTYLLARDEDCENMFHSAADFLNMFIAGGVLGLDDWRDVKTLV